MSANGGTSSGSKAQEPRKGRFFHHRLRRASFISPSTGERSKRNFTLLEASNRLSSDDNHASSSEATPLLPPNGQGQGSESWLTDTRNYLLAHAKAYFDFANSTTGRGIFKCSLAYLLGSLVTFIPALAGLIGNATDSKHMVATVTVWFHPARTIGSMHLATALGIIGFLYSAIIGFTSMAVSLAARHAGLLVAGHVIVLLVFLGGGVSSIAWVKQRFGDPLVNVATTLASLGCVLMLVREGSVQEGEFSFAAVAKVSVMILAGILISTTVNVLVFPTTARTRLKQDLEKNTDLLGELLIAITRAFLSGREDDLQDEYFSALQKEQLQALQKMSKDLGEAKNEYLVLGNEKLYHASSRLVDCLDELAQDLGGLRSAALAQFALVNSTSLDQEERKAASQFEHRRPSGYNSARGQLPSLLDAITEHPSEINSPDNEEEEAVVDDPDSRKSSFAPLDRVFSGGSLKSLIDPEDMFYTFIKQLGPPTKSLVYTLKQILDELPFRDPESPHPSPIMDWLNEDVEVAINDNFRSSLEDAIELYRTSRKDALNTLYASRALNAAFMPTGERKGGGAFSAQRTKTGFNSPADNQQSKTPLNRPPEEVLADIEEVSACCGHFSFSLLDFAEDIMTYLERLEELKTALEHNTFSWRWLMFWRTSFHTVRSKYKSAIGYEHDEEHGKHHDIPEPIRKADEFADPEKAPVHQPWTWKLYRKLRVFRRDDVKYAIKVGVGAVLFALPAFNNNTRPFFTHWRGEWGLVSYMTVCTMTIGAVNSTSINRFIGTFIGACLGIVGWVISADHGDANPYILAIFGWLVSVVCFYLILGKNQGPMGRFILLTYNLSALYAYSLSVHDEDKDDEGGIDPAIWDIVLHRLVAVVVGSLWAVIIIRIIWPISARRKVKDGLCILWLRMSLIWKRDPLAMFLIGEPRSSYMDIREEAELHSFLTYLDSLRSAAQAEFQLRGPFPDGIVGRIVERTRRMLDSFHAMNVVIAKEVQSTPGEAAVLRYTREQRFALSARISHLFSVLASSYKLEYPFNDALPSIENSRDQLLASISEFRRTGEGRDIATEGDYELLYAYVLVTGQLAQDIQAVSAELEVLFGTLNEENLKLQ